MIRNFINDIIVYVKIKCCAKLALYHINRGHSFVIKHINDKAIKHSKTAMKYLDIHNDLIDKFKRVES